MINFEKYPLPKRMRHHISPNVYLPVDDLTHIPDYYPEPIKSVDWSLHFQNQRPADVLDIGCGRGKFLFDMSFLYPDTNFLGIEVRPAPADWIKNVVAEEKRSNISVLLYSVANGLPFLSENSIEKVFYLFPDPWPKKRHHKRRAYNLRFLQEVHRVLKPQANLFLATDMEIVHLYHLETLREFGGFDVNIIETDDEWGFPITNKEDFCRQKDIPFFRISASKI